MRFLRHRPHGASALDITPLVDVVFLLNIFFLLTSSFYLSSGIKISVPKGVAERLESSDLIVSVTMGGRIYFQNETNVVSVNELIRRLRQLKREKPDAVVLLRGDTDCKFGRLIEVYSACKAAGIENIRVHTRPMVQPPAGAASAEAQR